VFASEHFNEFEPQDASSLLVLGAGQTVRPENDSAYGRFVVNMENHGLIDARSGRIDIVNDLTVNDGELAASDGGLLQLLNVAGTTDNRTGLIAARGGSRVEFRGHLRGGELDGPGVITLRNPATFSDHVTFLPDADVAVQTFGDLTLVWNHTNDGTVQLRPGIACAGSDSNCRTHFLNTFSWISRSRAHCATANPCSRMYRTASSLNSRENLRVGQIPALTRLPLHLRTGYCLFS
jgi:hypothetical protein